MYRADECIVGLSNTLISLVICILALAADWINAPHVIVAKESGREKGFQSKPCIGLFQIAGKYNSSGARARAGI